MIRRTLHRRLRQTLAGCLWAWASAVSAASLTVYVAGADGQPVSNAVVQVMAPGVAPRASAEPVVIVQKDIRFVPQVTAIPVGTTVRFTNQDPFDHHLRSQAPGPLGSGAPAKDFEFRMPGARPDKVVTTDVRFDQAGLVVLGCHLHSSMRGHVFVSESPLLGVTDAAGQVVIKDVPNGRIEVRSWHAEQLLDQQPVVLQIGGAANLTMTLNFTPPKPRRRGL